MSTPSHPSAIHQKVGCLDFCFISSLLRWSYSISRRFDTLLSLSLDSTTVSSDLARHPLPRPPTSNTREASPPNPVPTLPSPSPARRPPTQPSRQINKGTLSKRVSPLPEEGSERSRCAMPAFAGKEKIQQMPKSPRIFSFAASQLPDRPSGLRIYIPLLLKTPATPPIRHRKHVMCVCKAAEQTETEDTTPPKRIPQETRTTQFYTPNLTSRLCL